MLAFSPTLPNPKMGEAKRVWYFGPYGAAFFTDVESLSGNEKYPFVFEVRGPLPGKPELRLSVVSEPGVPTNFLCAITESGRRNYGSSDEWKVEEKFLEKAIEVAKDVMGVSEGISEVTPAYSEKATTVPVRFFESYLFWLPIMVAFAFAPFDWINGYGVARLNGWKFIFTAGAQGFQINFQIWVIQFVVAAAVGMLLFKSRRA